MRFARNHVPGLFLSVLFCLGLADAARAACPGQTQMELNECAAIDYKAADAELNAAWGATKSFYDGIGHGQDLLTAQRNWIAFRDANCEAEAALYEGGSIQPLIYSTCLTRLTRRRTEDLKQMNGY